MMMNYIHGAHAVLLCYDITNAHSFQNLEDWLMLVKRTFTATSPHHQPYIGLVANKSMIPPFHFLTHHPSLLSI
jgi:GTPase SAR1 family protein